MTKRIARWTAVLVLVLFCGACQSADRNTKSKERPAAVAGSFYPRDAGELTTFVDRALDEAKPPSIDAPPVALISPHAGYEYSGRVAAYSYALLKGRKFKRVVVIGPSHVEPFDFTSVYDGEAYSTPLGRIPVDREFARKLASADSTIHVASVGHSSNGDRSEHSVEVQLPFLQRALGEFAVVPIVMGDHSYRASRALGVALAKLLKNDTSTLLVASSDLSHYHTYDQASRMDQNLLGAIGQGDFLSVSDNIGRRVWEACGGAPIVALMIAAERLGAANPRVLKYANSGDVTSDKTRVVGYGAAAMFRETKAASEAKFTLSDADRAELLRIAKESVESAVRDRKSYEPPVPPSAALMQERGAFVTLTKDGNLRGCIGYTSAMAPLYMTVRDVARFAALRDPRFRPVRPEELKDLHYEVSVLSPFHHVLDTKNVLVGQHGLLIRRGDEEGILLPQVPVEQRWDRSTFLQQVSRKAGFEETAWEDPRSDLFSFTALVFSDHDAAKH